MINKCKTLSLSALDLSVENSKKILEVFIEEINKNYANIKKASQIDEQELVNVDVLISILKSNSVSSYGLIEEAFKNEFGIVMKNFVPYGTIYIDLGKINVLTLTKLIVLAISTRNAMIIKSEGNAITNEIILDITNKLLAQFGLESLVQVVYEDFFNSDLKFFDKIIVNNETKNKYADLELTIIGYPTVILYVDDDIDNKLVERVSEINNVKIYSKIDLDVDYEKVENLEDVLKKIGENNYSCGIFTKDKEVAKKFISKVKAKNVFVNVSPTNVVEVDLYAEDLLYRKNTVIYG